MELLKTHRWIDAPGGQGVATVCAVCAQKGSGQALDSPCPGPQLPPRQSVTLHDYDPFPATP